MHPVNGPITQVYGANPQFAWQLGHGHLGVDWGVPIGTPVRAIADGVCLFADWGQKMNASMCNDMMFIYGSPNSGIVFVGQYDGWRSADCHLDRTDMNPGQRFKRGDIIGYTGTTGNSTGPHLHKETWVGSPCSRVPSYGRYDPMRQIAHEDQVANAKPVIVPAAPPVNGWPAGVNRDYPDQRLVGRNGARFRTGPNTDSALLPRVAKAGTWEIFTHWAKGQKVDGIDLWYYDGVGWAWSGNFEAQDTRNLKEWQPPRPANQRQNGGSVAMQRALPSTSAKVVREIPPNQWEVFDKVCDGDEVTIGGRKSKLWYGDSIGWVSALIFTEQSTRGLTVVPRPQPPVSGPVPAPAPAPAPAPTPATPYSFDAAFRFVTKVVPAARGNFQEGNFPAAADVESVFVHQFNGATPQENPTVNRETVRIGSVDNTFTGSGRVASAHFGVDHDDIHQYVKLTDRAYAQGEANGEGWSVESYGAQDERTRQNVAQLIYLLEKHAGKKLRIRRHNEVMRTACGSYVDVDDYRRRVDALHAAEAAPVPAPNGAEGLLRAIRDMIDNFFKGKK